MGETLLPKKLALPVFSSDPLSSVAYATEEILLALSLGGLAMLTLSWWVGAGVVFLLLVVAASCRQSSRANLGENAALIAASALLIDYVMTVAVSVAAGGANIVSAVPARGSHAVAIALGRIAVIAVTNLRGVKESGRAFAIPTYGFVASVFLMVGAGLLRTAFGHAPTAESASLTVHASHGTAGAAALLLALRAFAQGCTALTGVEAVSNGVPSFRRPKSRNAAATLTIMGLLAVTMFGGITALASLAHVHVAGDPAQLVGAPPGYEQKTVIAQLGSAVFGSGSLLFFLVQAFTAAILVLAANTAFNGFPILASILGGDEYLPRQFGRRGDRLVFSNGIVILSLLAGALIWAFDASTTRLIQLYIIGVFVSLTLGQSGMVRHWGQELRGLGDPARRRRIQRSRAINLVGALLTGLVLVVVLLTRFTHGAWIVVVTMPLVFLMMKAIRRHYRRVAAELAAGEDDVALPSRIHGVVLVYRQHTPTLRAQAFA